MSGFDSTKNNLEKLKLYLRRLQYSQRNPCSPPLKDIDEQMVKQLNNQLFLPLINYILLDYSAELYIEILDKLPDIKYKDDRRFVQDVINLSRQIFKLSPSLNADQFLSNKYVDRKLQFVATLAKAVFDKVDALKKNKTKEKQQVGNLSRTLQQHLQFHNDFDDFDEEVPMAITAVPMKFDVQQLKRNQVQPNIKVNIQKNPSDHNKKGLTKGISNNMKNSKFTVEGYEFDEDEVERALQQRHPTPVSAVRKPKDQPIVTVDRQKNDQKYQQHDRIAKIEDQQDEQSRFLRFKLDETKNKVPKPGIHSQIQYGYGQGHGDQHKGIKSKQIEKMPAIQQQENIYVSRQQFMELVGLIKVVSETVNQISGKFGQLEASVNSQVNNINARIMMLESTVRLLKDNL